MSSINSLSSLVSVMSDRGASRAAAVARACSSCCLDRKETPAFVMSLFFLNWVELESVPSLIHLLKSKLCDNRNSSELACDEKRLSMPPYFRGKMNTL